MNEMNGRQSVDSFFKDLAVKAEFELNELPKTISLRRSVCVSLNALNNDEQALNNQMNQVVANLQATRKAREEIMAEIAADNNISVEALSGYQYNGKELFKK